MLMLTRLQEPISLTLIPGLNRSEIGPEEYGPDDARTIERNSEAQLHIASHLAIHRIDP